MSKQTKTLKQLKKAGILANRAFHKNGPKSYKKGQGALLKVLHVHDGEMTSRELVDVLGYSRGQLKDVVRKAQRNEYVTIADHEDKRTDTVKITEQGDKIAEKRCAAHEKTAAAILSSLSDEEIDQLNRETFVEAGGGDFHYVPWGNDSDGAVASLEEQARIALAGWV